jgi:hypothetical protein
VGVGKTGLVAGSGEIVAVSDMVEVGVISRVSVRIWVAVGTTVWVGVARSSNNTRLWGRSTWA